jgi:hypothetical protein
MKAVFKPSSLASASVSRSSTENNKQQLRKRPHACRYDLKMFALKKG